MCSSPAKKSNKHNTSHSANALLGVVFDFIQNTNKSPRETLEWCCAEKVRRRFSALNKKCACKCLQVQQREESIWDSPGKPQMLPLISSHHVGVLQLYTNVAFLGGTFCGIIHIQGMTSSQNIPWNVGERYQSIFCRKCHPWYIFGHAFKMMCENLKKIRLIFFKMQSVFILAICNRRQYLVSV